MATGGEALKYRMGGDRRSRAGEGSVRRRKFLINCQSEHCEACRESFPQYFARVHPQTREEEDDDDDDNDDNDVYEDITNGKEKERCFMEEGSDTGAMETSGGKVKSTSSLDLESSLTRSLSGRCSFCASSISMANMLSKSQSTWESKPSDFDDCINCRMERSIEIVNSVELTYYREPKPPSCFTGLKVFIKAFLGAFFSFFSSPDRPKVKTIKPTLQRSRKSGVKKKKKMPPRPPVISAGLERSSDLKGKHSSQHDKKIKERTTPLDDARSSCPRRQVEGRRSSTSSPAKRPNVTSHLIQSGHQPLVKSGLTKSRSSSHSSGIESSSSRDLAATSTANEYRQTVASEPILAASQLDDNSLNARAMPRKDETWSNDNLTAISGSITKRSYQHESLTPSCHSDTQSVQTTVDSLLSRCPDAPSHFPESHIRSISIPRSPLTAEIREDHATDSQVTDSFHDSGFASSLPTSSTASNASIPIPSVVFAGARAKTTTFQKAKGHRRKDTASLSSSLRRHSSTQSSSSPSSPPPPMSHSSYQPIDHRSISESDSLCLSLSPSLTSDSSSFPDNQFHRGRRTSSDIDAFSINYDIIRSREPTRDQCNISDFDGNFQDGRYVQEQRVLRAPSSSSVVVVVVVDEGSFGSTSSIHTLNEDCLQQRPKLIHQSPSLSRGFEPAAAASSRFLDGAPRKIQSKATDSTPRASAIQTKTSHSTPRASAIQTKTSHSTPRASAIQTKTSHSTPRASAIQTKTSDTTDSTPRASAIQTKTSHSTPRASAIQTKTSHITPRVSAIQTKTSGSTPHAIQTKATDTVPLPLPPAIQTKATDSTPRAKQTNSTGSTPRAKTKTTDSAPRVKQTKTTGSSAPRATQTKTTDGAPGIKQTKTTDSAPRVKQTKTTDSAPRAKQTKTTDGVPRVKQTKTTDSAPRAKQTKTTDGVPRVKQTKTTDGAPGVKKTKTTDGAPGVKQTKTTADDDSMHDDFVMIAVVDVSAMNTQQSAVCRECLPEDTKDQWVVVEMDDSGCAYEDPRPLPMGYHSTLTRPAEGQSLINYLISQDFNTCANLEKENAHFHISEALIAAFESMSWNRMMKKSIPERSSSSSDEEIQELRQRIRIRKKEKMIEKNSPFPSVSDAPTDTSGQGLSPPDTPLSESLASDEEDGEQEEIDLTMSSDAHGNLQGLKSRGLNLSMASLYSDAELSRSNQQIHRNRAQEVSDGSAEKVAISLLKKFSEKHLPKASELKWLVSEVDAPQQLLPLPSSIPISPDDGENADYMRSTQTRIRGNLEWAPPRSQIIFSIHPTEKRAVVMARQNYRCAGCGIRVDPAFIKRYRYCEYLGKYFCQCCHSGDTSAIPGRVIERWDFSHYPVSNFSYSLLEKMWAEPLFHIDSVNPGLYRRVRGLDAIKMGRQQLHYLHSLFEVCKRDSRLVSEMQKMPAHWINNDNAFSMEDFLLVKNNSMLGAINTFVVSAYSHVRHCQLCQGLGFICGLCENKRVIFPFQLNSVARCEVCHYCYHRKCIAKEKCPKCLRIASRRKQLVDKDSSTSPSSESVDSQEGLAARKDDSQPA